MIKNRFLLAFGGLLLLIGANLTVIGFVGLCGLWVATVKHEDLYQIPLYIGVILGIVGASMVGSSLTVKKD